MAEKDRPTFEALPIELHFQVLSHMSSPRDVLSTIQASPAALRALQTGRERIYAAVLETSLGPEVFRELLAIVNAPDHNECPKVRGPSQNAYRAGGRDAELATWREWEEKVMGFFRSHAHGAVYPIPHSTNYTAQMMFIVRLYFCLYRWVNFFPSFVKCKATRTNLVFPHATTLGYGHRDQEDLDSPPLTDTELLRLRRGLLRYELCCRLIGIPSSALICNYSLYTDVSHPRSPEQVDFWNRNPFYKLLPMDEVEEIVCASVYMRELYYSLHRSLAEEFGNAVLEIHHDRPDGVPQKGMRAVMQWLSKDDFLSGSMHHGKVGNRLGLVFLDRVIRSNLADRRKVLQDALHSFSALHLGEFLDPRWIQIYRRRALGEGGPLEHGPYCNPMVRIYSDDGDLVRSINSRGTAALRSIGWVFFDDLSRIRSFGLPLDATASWFTKEALKHLQHRPLPILPLAIKNILLTEEEWRNLSPEKYILVNRYDHCEAMTRFVAGARAVVDFTSNELPQMVSRLPSSKQSASNN